MSIHTHSTIERPALSPAALADRFAQGEQTEELTLCGETITTRPARAVSTDRQTSILLT